MSEEKTDYYLLLDETVRNTAEKFTKLDTKKYPPVKHLIEKIKDTARIKTTREFNATKTAIEKAILAVQRQITNEIIDMTITPEDLRKLEDYFLNSKWQDKPSEKEIENILKKMKEIQSSVSPAPTLPENIQEVLKRMKHLADRPVSANRKKLETVLKLVH